MKEVKINRNWSIEIGNYSYKLPNESIEIIKKSNSVDVDYKYAIYTLIQNNKCQDHISIEDFKKIYDKCKKSSEDSLNSYTRDMVKSKVLDVTKVYFNYILDNKKEIIFRSSYNPNDYITYRFKGSQIEDIVDIEEVTDLDNLMKYNKNFDLIPGTGFPFLIFVDRILSYMYYPEEKEIYKYCKSLSANSNSAQKIIYQYRGRKFVL